MRTRWRSTYTMAEAAKMQRRCPTKAETAMWYFLRGLRPLGWIFRRQVPMGHFVLDFYCSKAKIAVEVDGNIHDDPRIRESDTARQAYLEHFHKITVLRYTNDEVTHSPIEVRDKIHDQLDATRREQSE
jgi:very-short-patch-repair endonuclease